MSVSRRGAVAALALACLVTSACGARWTDEQKLAVQQRASASSSDRAVDQGGAVAETDLPQSGSDATGTEATTEPGQAPVVGSTGVVAGDPAAGGEVLVVGALPCAATSDEVGVTDDEIRIGSVSALSGPVPGLGASSAGAVRAHVAYRNATGGVCGRQVDLQEVDDGTDLGRYRSIITDLEKDVLGIAGGFTIGDVGGVDVIRRTGLPVVNVPGADAVQALPTAFDINPPYDDLGAVIGKYRFLKEQGASKAAMAYLAVDSSRAEANVQKQLMQAAGIEIAQVQELPVSTLAFDSAARGVANSGADYLFFIGDQNSNAKMARAMADSDYDLEFAEYFTFAYGTDFVDRAGADAAEGALSWIRTLPNEEAGQNAEMASFVEWMERVAPGDVKDVFAADSWAATKAFLDSLEALPGPITREALVAELGSVDVYEAGGMLGPIRLGAERTNGCFIAMQVQDGRWQRSTPAKGFLC